MAALNQHSKTQQDSSVEPGRDRTPVGWDKAESPGTNGGDRVTNGAGRMIYAIITVVVFATTLVNAFSTAYDAVRRGGVYDLSLPLLLELSSGVVIVALAPLIDFGVQGARHESTWNGTAVLRTAYRGDGGTAQTRVGGVRQFLQLWLGAVPTDL
jgi:hypothetical protein